MTMLSAGTPMFLMGEEIGAQKRYTYDTFVKNKEDILGEAVGNGAELFAFYSDMVRLSANRSEVRSRNLAVLWTDNAARVIAFVRWDGDRKLLVAASLANHPQTFGLQSSHLGDFAWREVFNSDAAAYGGWGVGNVQAHGGAALQARGGALSIVIPACGAVVFQREQS